MTQDYQTITIKGSNEKYIVSSMEYPFQQLNILYIKFIVYNKLRGDNDSIIMKPISFLTVQPQDILSRIYNWSQDHEDELIDASNTAIQQRKDYQEALEEEMKQKILVKSIIPMSDEGECSIPIPDAPSKYDNMWT